MAGHKLFATLYSRLLDTDTYFFINWATDHLLGGSVWVIVLLAAAIVLAIVFLIRYVRKTMGQQIARLEERRVHSNTASVRKARTAKSQLQTVAGANSSNKHDRKLENASPSPFLVVLLAPVALLTLLAMSAYRVIKRTAQFIFAWILFNVSLSSKKVAHWLRSINYSCLVAIWQAYQRYLFRIYATSKLLWLNQWHKTILIIVFYWEPIYCLVGKVLLSSVQVSRQLVTIVAAYSHQCTTGFIFIIQSSIIFFIQLWHSSLLWRKRLTASLLFWCKAYLITFIDAAALLHLYVCKLAIAGRHQWQSRRLQIYVAWAHFWQHHRLQLCQYQWIYNLIYIQMQQLIQWPTKIYHCLSLISAHVLMKPWIIDFNYFSRQQLSRWMIHISLLINREKTAWRHLVRCGVEDYLHTPLRILLLIVQDSWLLLRLTYFYFTVAIKPISRYCQNFSQLLFLHSSKLATAMTSMTSWFQLLFTGLCFRWLFKLSMSIYNCLNAFGVHVIHLIVNSYKGIVHQITFYAPYLKKTAWIWLIGMSSYTFTFYTMIVLFIKQIIGHTAATIGPFCHQVIYWSRWLLEISKLLLRNSISTVRWWIQR